MMRRERRSEEAGGGVNIHDAKLMSRALQVNGWERATLGWAGEF